MSTKTKSCLQTKSSFLWYIQAGKWFQIYGKGAGILILPLLFMSRGKTNEKVERGLA